MRVPHGAPHLAADCDGLDGHPTPAVYELGTLPELMPLVLLVSYSSALGGAERILLDFATAIEGELCLACPDGQLAGAARAVGIRVFPLHARRLELRATTRDRALAAQRLAAHARDARALVRDLDPDLVLACGMRSAIALLIGPPIGRPVVFQHNDMLPGRVVGRLVRRAAARADLVVVLSRAIAEELDARSRTVVVHPGVDIERFGPNTGPVTPPEVLVLGALVAWKRPDVALEACALARRRRPDLRLRLVGAPLNGDSEGLVRRLRQRASRPDLAGAVEFTGAVADPRPELARATCLLHCAPREPFGLAVLEALAAGRPAVVPAAAGPAEIVDESCAVLYPPGDAAAAAEAVLELLESPERASRMGTSGRARAGERFGLADAQKQFAAAAQPMMRRRPAASATTGALALLTVTHDSAPQLEALLRSMERNLPSARVVVVDCASSDGTVEVARRWKRSVSVTVVALEENVGFGRACNLGMAQISEPVTALVNPDVELLDGSLPSLAAEAMKRDRPERLLAPLVLRADGSRQDSVHPLPTSGAEIARAIIPPIVLPGRFGARVAPWRSRAPRQVGWAVGCALVARSETLRRLGPFDERIFMYGEDLDLGLAGAARGVHTWFWPSGRVLHHGAHATGPAFGGEPFELLARTRHDVVARRLGPQRARLDDAAQTLTFASRIVLKRAVGRSVARECRQLRAVLRRPRAAK
jgi:N-acetylglucosaminyl-diphospho-decaprenol L-rhamnosyltransferase